MKRLKELVVLLVCSCLMLAACGDGTDESNTAEESTSIFAETATLQDTDGNDIVLTKTNDVEVYGTYVCAADSSVWSFGGEVLGMAVLEEDGSLGSYVCQLGFFQTEADEEGYADLVMAVYNCNSEVTTCWLVSNGVDEEGNTIGICLTLFGDDSVQVQLVSQDYYNSLVTSSGDAAASGDAAE